MSERTYYGPRPVEACLLRLHTWRYPTRKNKSVNTYAECSGCGQRRVQFPRSGYQPVDWEWLTDVV